MTINADNQQISKMIALLTKLGVSAQDCELAKKYLNGDAGDEVLDQFERKDLSGGTRQIYDDAKRIVRFFNVVYAIGQGSCHSLFWYNAIDRAEEYELYKRKYCPR